MKAIWNNTVIAESDHTLKIESHTYFPADSVNMDYLEKNGNSDCDQQGDACYYDIVAGGKKAIDAASSFDPGEASSNMRNYIVFSKDVVIEE